jgi:hypothetical protein
MEVEMSNPNRVGLNAVLECHPGTGYDEDTFRYFLAVERARAERSNHPLRLLFATLEPIPGTPAQIPDASGTRLLKGLKMSLRETDVTGWYRQGRVAAAVLSECAEAPGADVSDVIEKRVTEEMRQRLPSKIARNLSVHVIQQGPRRIGNR